MFISKKLIRLGALAAIIMGLLMAWRYSTHAQGGISIEEAKRVAMNAGWGKNVTLEFDKDNNMIIRSNGLPNHEILAVYQAVSVVDNKTTYVIKPQEQHMKVVIPLLPKLAAKKTSSSIGLIGIAISGGLFYSPFEADGKTLALDQKNLVVDGIPFLDACNGHPNPFAVQYHYHGVPHCITDVIDKPGEHAHLVGYLLDGFPVYGPQGEKGKLLTPADLDECNGQFGPTPEFPNGIYHYVLTETAPYSIPCYSGEIDLSSSPIGLFTRGADLSFPPPLIPPAALFPPTPKPSATSSN